MRIIQKIKKLRKCLLGTGIRARRDAGCDGIGPFGCRLGEDA